MTLKDDSLTITFGNSSLTIELSEGGRVKQLILNNSLIIDSLPVDYSLSYSSSILFPFVNRIENGCYNYNGKQYKLDINLNPNAIHGLVYDRPFKLVETSLDDDHASIAIEYDSKEVHSGYPFLYTLRLTYSISQRDFALDIEVKNLNEVKMPINLGWHPYFYTSDLNNTSLKLNSNIQYMLNEHLIPVGTKEIEWQGFKDISKDTYDDCYLLNENTFEFRTPDYHMLFSSSLDQNYVQIYTPDQRNYIALEPMSSPPNSFNNKIGLKELSPSESFCVEWKIKLI